MSAFVVPDLCMLLRDFSDHNNNSLRNAIVITGVRRDARWDLLLAAKIRLRSMLNGVARRDSRRNAAE